MATRTRKVNGGLNGGLPIDPQVVRTRAEQVTGAAGGIARIADEVFEGTEVQLRIARRGRERHQRDGGVAQGNGVAGGFGGGVVGRAGLLDQRDGGLDRTDDQQHREPRHVGCRNRVVGAGDDRVHPIGRAPRRRKWRRRRRKWRLDRRDDGGDENHQPRYRALASSVNETAAAIEEMSRSIDGVAGNANDLAAARRARRRRRSTRWPRRSRKSAR